MRFQKQCSLVLACLLLCLQGLPAEARGKGPQANSGVSSEDSVAGLRSYLGDHPEVASELKSLLADKLGEQGSAIDAQSITDQVLINRLQSDAAFRGDALRLMVNRGYIREEQAQGWARTLSSSRGPNSETGSETGTTEQQYPEAGYPEARYPQGSSPTQYPCGTVSCAASRTAVTPGRLAANSSWQPGNLSCAGTTGNDCFRSTGSAKTPSSTAECRRACSADTQHRSAGESVPRAAFHRRPLSSLRS